MTKNDAAILFSLIAFVVGIVVFSYWPMVAWPQAEKAKAAEQREQDRLFREVPVPEYNMVWHWREKKSYIPGVKEAIADAMRDGKITQREFDQIDDKITEYKEIKEKYEAIKALQSVDLTSQKER